MLVIRKINNNVALCRDSNGAELVAFGKGIGFPETPYELKDLSKIDVTFYNISEQYFDVLNEIPSEVMEFTARIADKIRISLPYELKPTFLLTLADHLAFCMERQRKNIYVHMPLTYEISAMYPQEVKIGKAVLEEIRRVFGVQLNSREVYGIVLSIINSRMDAAENGSGIRQKQLDSLILKIDAVIERMFSITIERDTFSYARFSSHLQHLFSRLASAGSLQSTNIKLYEKMKIEFPKTDRCVEEISALIQEELGYEITDEEKMYLIMHVNRICQKESI